jgi:hypothetical protein
VRRGGDSLGPTVMPYGSASPPAGLPATPTCGVMRQPTSPRDRALLRLVFAPRGNGQTEPSRAVESSRGPCPSPRRSGQAGSGRAPAGRSAPITQRHECADHPRSQRCRRTRVLAGYRGEPAGVLSFRTLLFTSCSVGAFPPIGTGHGARGTGHGGHAQRACNDARQGALSGEATLPRTARQRQIARFEQPLRARGAGAAPPGAGWYPASVEATWQSATDCCRSAALRPPGRAAHPAGCG